METGRKYTYSQGQSWVERIIGSLIFLMIILLFFYLSFQIYKILFLLTPLFIIVALAIQPKVVWEYVKNIAANFKNNFLGGLFHLMVQIIGMPIVSIGLIFKAWVYKKLGTINNQINDEEEFTPYDEVENHKFDLSEKPKKERASNRYDELFE
jgi:hypothetical protein